MGQVNQAIASMDADTQRIAAFVEESTSATQEMVDQAGYLHELVGKFRLSAPAGRSTPGLAAPMGALPARRK